MTATTPRHRDITPTTPRHRRSRFRAPPPTPIRTGKGFRSAAIDDRILADFLETSLRVPDLTLPRTHFSSPRAPSTISDEIGFKELKERDIVAVGNVVYNVRETGAFRVGSKSMSVQEVTSTIRVAKEVFSVPEEMKRDSLAKWFRRRDVVEEEFYWYHPVRPEMDRVLLSAFPNPKSYHMFREKMESIASEMQKIAELVTDVLCSNSKKGWGSSSIVHKPPSVLCLTKFNVNQSYLTWNELGDAEQPTSYAVCLHASSQDQEFRLCSQEGSNFCKTPAGSALVTVGKQLQDWSNREYKSAAAEVLYELSEDPNPFYSLEFFYITEDTSDKVGTSFRDKDLQPNTISIKHQVFIVAGAIYFFRFLWFWIGFEFF
ncbi:2-oxoglutarate (2OG) and Fe(II)-dependent oxygenase superfamily protein [Rhynchospora pubera]|uniref:2-oxoglutarate (2OG) and Fe(II)-dependent oxygenase superfamily protein n=1 Tax=Rhynchospora pubera TaxID=906938 RepID=A0AAV8DDV6_9POAL|nr:2-oxoglutarate (2OG) and Fe(II)-dependent oxygenase superfamily protein [Rhynchospora pubera]